MASTIPISRTISFAQGFVQVRPLLGVGGFANEPGLSIGDWVRQFILAPPFSWRWNRTTNVFATVIGQQDYPVTITDYGWMKTASINAAGFNKELKLKQSLAVTNKQAEPADISSYLDNDSGLITFRFLPVPDKVYTANIIYQKAPVLFTTTADFWTPIPDYLSYLYNQGFVAKAYELAGDERFGFSMQLFLRQLIATSEGLTETEKSLFLDERVAALREMQDHLGVAEGSSQTFGRSER